MNGDALPSGESASDDAMAVDVTWTPDPTGDRAGSDYPTASDTSFTETQDGKRTVGVGRNVRNRELTPMGWAPNE